MYIGQNQGLHENQDREVLGLTLNLLKTTIIATLSNASKWQMGFNSAFKGLIVSAH